MIVVSDAGPLRYLIQIKRVDDLRRFYERVFVPPSVVVELSQPKTPGVVRNWMASPPDWLEVRRPNSIDKIEPGGLGAGETEAIEFNIPVLVGDRDAQRLAASHSVENLGTLAILIRSHREGFSDLGESLSRLEATTFRRTAALWSQTWASASREA